MLCRWKRTSLPHHQAMELLGVYHLRGLLFYRDLFRVRTTLGYAVFLTEKPSLAQSTVSQHLKVLKSAGLIKGTIEGKQSKYCIHQQNFKKLMTYFSDFTNVIDCSYKC